MVRRSPMKMGVFFRLGLIFLGLCLLLVAGHPEIHPLNFLHHENAVVKLGRWGSHTVVSTICMAHSILYMPGKTARGNIIYGDTIII